SAEKDIIKYIFKKIILKSPDIEQALDERFINWQVDKEVLQAMIAKTFKNFSSEVPAKNKLADLTPSWLEDKDFIIDLLKMTIKSEDEYLDMIAVKTECWGSDRIALVDNLLMRMAITALINLPTSPVHVTINEYIELSRSFSTLKSSTFITGIL